MKRLQIASDLALPAAVASQAVCLIGIRGSGKTNTAGVMAEELLDHGQPIVVLDPTDAWFGLRSSRDGKSDGYPIYVFGGPHGDLDLLETSGKEIAEFVAATRVSVILSLRHLRKNAQRRFVTEFCEELYHLKGKPEYRSPLTVFVDEAPLFVPQKVMGENARTVGAVEDLIARGRNAGFGVVLLSQRLATVNKDVATQCDTIICHRVPSPQDRKAIADWFEENASVDELKTILGSLATLKNGEAWVWAPSVSIIQRTQIRLRKTYDSSATPQGTPVPPKVMTKVDIDALRSKLAASVERTKADDPKELKRVIAAKDREIQELRKSAGNHAVAHSEKTRDVPVLTEADRELLARLDARIVAAAERVTPEIDLERLITNLTGQIRACLGHLSQEAAAARGELVRLLEGKRIGFIRARADEYRKIVIPDRAPHSRPAAHASPNQAPTSQANGQRAADPSLGKCEKAILRVLVHQSDGCDVGRLTLLSGYRYSGGFRNSLSALRQAGLIAGENGGTIAITGAGAHAIGDVEPLPTGRELGRYWLNHPSFGKAEQAILGALLNHPKGLDADGLCKATGYEYSGGFRNALGALRTAGVLVGKNTGVMQASEELFG